MAVAEAPAEDALTEAATAEALAEESLPEMKVTPTAPSHAAEEPLPEMKASPTAQAEPLPEMKATPTAPSHATEEPLPEMRATPTATATAQAEPLPEMSPTPTAKAEEPLPEMKGTPTEAPEFEAPSEPQPEYAEAGIEMEWEVETIPREKEPVEEPIITETIVEEYTGPSYDSDDEGEYDHGYDRGFDQDFDDDRQTFDQGWNGGYVRRGVAARRMNKHIFTWVFSFFLGIYGVDRFFRGQTFLGLMKLLTFGGLGLWYCIDVIVALINSYAGPYKYEEDVKFDRYGRYVM